MKVQLTKRQFVKIIKLMQNFHSEQETLGVLINKITDCNPVVIMGDNLIDGIINILNEIFCCENDNIIGWWLYEPVEKVIYDGEYGEREISVRTPEELYDYLVKFKGIDN
jgi:hypothetical protein